ncbi:craniofacial development protein 1 [Nothobranchius furzeri]|uniref:Craniofacial development protein 1 n=1 Tax=Nothobranchius furzeri TaxID=105023 RepID=A0A1A8V5G6_NOTFU|nr:craniofacial development protein 1 [Nothobranchius furzeri]KAF7215147.1 craniofacial development protein 1 [Nothobranchius furzeri]
MSYSDYDSDGYVSNEDADYIPSDDNLSEDDINECEKEEALHEDESVPYPDRKGKKKGIKSRRNRAQRLNEEETVGSGAEKARLAPHAGGDEETQKKKSDDLWASFLSDVGTRPKDSAPSAESGTNKEMHSSVLQTPPKNTDTKAAGPEKITITKVFDFAGEEVRVHKEVSADSKEARSFLKSQNSQQDETKNGENSSLCPPSLPGPSCSAKRSAGMSSILGRIGGKKQKMSTLEKSKMDWDAFKYEEGITDELAIHNRGKEGYVERKNFLERVDHRQFEREKAVRLSNMKR